jgi:hypothetical protein
MRLGQNACLGNCLISLISQVSDLGPSWPSCLLVSATYSILTKKSNNKKMKFSFYEFSDNLIKLLFDMNQNDAHQDLSHSLTLYCTGDSSL